MSSQAIDCLAVMILKDYGKAHLDFSHEFLNLFTGLIEHPRLRVRAFHPDLEALRHGADGMRERFRDLIRRDRPTLLVHHPFNHELDVDLDALTEATEGGTITVAFDADSSWRFDEWIRPRMKHYALHVTTHPGSVARYEAAGARVHLSQWAVSSWYRGRAPGGTRDVPVSFIGRRHGDRQAVIRRIRRGGQRIDCWGKGWNRGLSWLPRVMGRGRNVGYASFSAMCDAFARSRISINLANASDPIRGNQIKGRHFEIPAFGACQVTTPADAIEDYYEPGSEIIVAADEAELIESVRALIRDPARAVRIAEAGWRRTWAQHTWRHRIDDLLAFMDL